MMVSSALAAPWQRSSPFCMDSTTFLAGSRLHRLPRSQSVPWSCRDGNLYGCGSTEYGQLPYLKFAGPSGSEGGDSSDMDIESREPRNEVTVPTRLALPFLQQQRGEQTPVVSAVVLGPQSTALLTRAPQEFPETQSPHLWER